MSTTRVLKCQCGDPNCCHYKLSTQGSVGFSLADATLYAAAEDLLDSLENLLIHISMGWELDGLLEAANAAVRNARP